MWGKVVVLVVQILLEVVRLIPKGKKPAEPAPSKNPTNNEPAEALDRARERAKHHN